MNLIRGIHNLKPEHRGCAVTIGSFDGLHLGHQIILKRLLEKAKILKLPSLIITFEPLPREFFTGEEAVPRLTRLREKLNLIKSFGIDRVLCIRFNKTLANLEVPEFIQQILVDGLGIKHLSIGHDFRFGRKRSGDAMALQAAGEKHGFSVEVIGDQLHNHERISSTLIRKYLSNGELYKAAELLGRPYSMEGNVVHGEKRGRLLGFPTANIALKRRQTPLMGIFVVRIYGIKEQPLPAVASLGVRPTFDGKICLLEVHLLDFDQDIYGKHLKIEFLHKLRDEQRFESEASLIKAMQNDLTQTRKWFQQYAN